MVRNKIEFEERKEELETQIIELKEELNKREEEIKATKYISNPKSTKKYFLKQQGKLIKLKSAIFNIELPPLKELQEPILLLMRNDGYTDIIEGVEPGEFVVQDKSGEKSFMLSPKKVTTLRYGEQHIKMWVQHEDCMSPYPQDPVHNAEMYRKTTQKLIMNVMDRDEVTKIQATTKMWLYIIGGIALAIILFMSTSTGKEFISSIGKETVVSVATTIQQNVTNAVTSGGITVQ